jgi:biopolymer transport protein ExbB/TolQ/biopolymer transport protein ExbD
VVDFLTHALFTFASQGARAVMILLIFLSVLSIAVTIERGIYFGRRRMSRTFPEMLSLCLKGELSKAARLAAESDSMESEVVRAAAEAAPGGQGAVEKAVASTIDRRKLEYEQYLFILGTLGNNTPFLGLLGTVLGIMRAFYDLAQAPKAGAAGTSAVMLGIGEALVATAVGLAVAIPAVIAFNVFQRLLKRVIGRSQSLSNAGPGRAPRSPVMAGGAEEQDEAITGINVTPLVDIMLVLLIIFMVTATYIVKETIEVELPRAAHGGETVKTTFALMLSREGKTYLNGLLTDDAGLVRSVGEARSKGEDVQAIVGADKSATHGAVTHLLDVLKGAGVTKFAIQIEKQ